MGKRKNINIGLFLFLIFVLSLTTVYADETSSVTDNVVAETTKYYKTVSILSNSEMMQNTIFGEISSITTEVTKEEYDNAPTDAEKQEQQARGIVDSGSTQTDYKKLTSTISRPATDVFEYFATLEWKNMPKVRSYDIIGIGFYGSVKNASMVDLTNEYCLSNGECDEYISYYMYDGIFGCGAMFPVPTGTLSSMKQTLEIQIEKRNSAQTIIEQKAVASYRHAVKSISYNNAKNFFVDIDGINLDGIESYYDSMSNVASYWTGSW